MPADSPAYEVFPTSWSMTCGRLALQDPSDYLAWLYRPGGVLEITEIQVMSERGVGKGRCLVATLEKFARKEECRLMFAMTRRSNKIARQFYEKLGFTMGAAVQDFYAGITPYEATMVLYVKPLSYGDSK